MPYKISSSDNNQLVFERVSAGCAMGMFIGVGTLFFIIGVLLNIFMSGFEFPNLLFKLLFPLFGLGAIVTGIYMPKITRETTPESFTFDNSKGAVIIQMLKDGSQTGYIRYDEIETFDIFTETRRSSSSSSRGTSTTSYYYHVLLRKKDGGEWYLTESGSRKNAEEILQQINTTVRLNNPYSLRVTPVFTNKLIKEESHSKTVIKWQNKVSLIAPLFLLVFLFTFIGIATTVLKEFSGDAFGIFPFFILGFIFLVFCFVLYGIGKRMYTDFTSTYNIMIDRQNFEYFETAKSTGEVTKSKIVPLKDVYMISYTFTPIKNYGDRGLEIRTREDYNLLQKHKEKPLEALKDIFSDKDETIKLNITGLHPVECLQLETWLQDQIKKRGDVEVL